MFQHSKKAALLEFAYIVNIKTCVEELKKAAQATDITIADLYHAFDLALDKKAILFFDKFIHETKDEKQHHCACFDTGFKTSNNEPILGWLTKGKEGKSWVGIRFNTKAECKEESNYFKMGTLRFSEFKDGPAFLNKLADTAIPETWTYRSFDSKIPHPILRAYIENTLARLLYEDQGKDQGKKVFLDDNKKHILFNTGLLNRFFHEMFIIADTSPNPNEFFNPRLITSKKKDLAEISFTINGEVPTEDAELPKKASYFKDVNEIIYQSDYKIDNDFTKYCHIVEERKDRFPAEYLTKSSDERARALDTAVAYAVKITERNYNFIVPQYRPQTNKIQLLMPIYLGGAFTTKPDFALVLDIEGKWYIPETILPLDAAYQNARLISKPAEFWLSPEKI